jgi:hypothetical protein
MNMAGCFKATKAASRAHIHVFSSSIKPSLRDAFQHISNSCVLTNHTNRIGGDIIEYPGEVATKTADLTVTKAILNSVCSTKAALYTNMDIKITTLGLPWNDMNMYAFLSAWCLEKL